MKKIIVAVGVTASFIAGYFLSEYLDSRTNQRLSLELAIRGTQELEGKNYNESLRNLFTALYFNPDNRLAHQGLGYFFYKQGLNDLALKEFENFVESPKDVLLEKIGGGKLHIDVAMGYCYLADLYEKKGEKEMMVKNFQRAVNEFPELPQYLLNHIKLIVEKKEKNADDSQMLRLYSQFYDNVKTLRKKN